MLLRDLTSLATFFVVAEERSFTRAAKRQGVSPSAVSYSMRALEEDVGVRLLARTTRSVSLTEAGEQLLGRLRPALSEVGETLEEISGRRNKTAGRIRLLLPRQYPESFLTSPPMTVAVILWRKASTPGFILVSTFRKM
jgi:DNA-binding transcriptional LysR family regulator